MRKVKVLFVCLGNICRSPLAEAIFNDKISKKGLEHLVEAESCGTANYHIGHSPDPRTIENALKNGITINHVGQQLSSKHIHEFDFILAMDQNNFNDIVRLESAASYKQKISLMRSFDLERDDDVVPDPYYGNESDFQQVFEILDRSVDYFVKFLVRENFRA